MTTSKKRAPKPQSLAALAKTFDLDRERSCAIERVVALCENDGGDTEEFNKALDLLVIAHMAVTFQFASNSFS